LEDVESKIVSGLGHKNNSVFEGRRKFGEETQGKTNAKIRIMDRCEKPSVEFFLGRAKPWGNFKITAKEGDFKAPVWS